MLSDTRVSIHLTPGCQVCRDPGVRQLILALKKEDAYNQIPFRYLYH